jgi:hypothetical protein
MWGLALTVDRVYPIVHLDALLVKDREDRSVRPAPATSRSE